MAVTVLLGGARSGKSAIAARLAERSDAPVVAIVTGEAGDEEMAERIRRHRAARPPAWETVEEPLELEAALRSAPEGAAVIVDCLTLWVANLLERGDTDEEVEHLSASAASAAAQRPGLTLVVTNEVGSGIVPANAYARRFRDLQGRVNVAWTGVADRAALVVAGSVLPLEAAEDLHG